MTQDGFLYPGTAHCGANNDAPLGSGMATILVHALNGKRKVLKRRNLL